MDDHAELSELAAIEPLGALDDEDAARLRAHLAAGCAECGAIAREAEQAAARLALTAPPLAPAPALRGRVLASLRAAGEPRPLRPPAPPARPGRMLRVARAASWLAAAAGVVLALLSSLEASRLRGELAQEGAERRRAETELARESEERRRAEGALLAATTTCEAGERERVRLASLVDALGAPGARAVPLAGQGPAVGSHATAWVAPGAKRILLFASDLAPAPPGRSYQLWVISGGVPASAGVFDAGADRRARHDVTTDAPLGEGSALAVTLEPAGGVPQPTGPMVLVQG
jgi:anti-sigma-K factor RskA